MMGTGPFAVPTFRRLLDGPHAVELLVTRPPRELHGKQQADVNPMREVARERGLPIFEPESINTDEARAELARYQPDLFVVCDYGQILKPETLAIARLGGINLHASLLPKYRGAAPINWAVYHGDTVTGDTVIHMSPAVDAGPAIAQVRLPIGPDDTAADLERRLAELGAPLVLQSIEDLIAGKAVAIDQDASQATRAPRLKKTDGQVDWSRPATAIRNQIRALVPWPKTHTFWQRPAGEPLRLILEKVSVIDGRGEPGVVLEAAGDRLVIAAGEQALLLEAIQPAGKRVLSAAEFLRGYPVRVGERFGRFPSAEQLDLGDRGMRQGIRMTEGAESNACDDETNARTFRNSTSDFRISSSSPVSPAASPYLLNFSRRLESNIAGLRPTQPAFPAGPREPGPPVKIGGVIGAGALADRKMETEPRVREWMP